MIFGKPKNNIKIVVLYSQAVTILSFVIISSVLFSVSHINQHAIAQNNITEPDTTGWYSIIGISGLLSAGVSAFTNYIITSRQLKTQHDNALAELNASLKIQHKNTITELKAGYANTILQLREQKQVELMQDKLNLYSSFIYHLKRMTTSTAFRKGTEQIIQIEETIHEIDSY